MVKEAATEASGETPDVFDQFQEPPSPAAESPSEGVTVRVAADQRVMFGPAPEAVDEPQMSDEKKEALESPPSPPPQQPNRRRLRPIKDAMDTGEQSSPEPYQPRGAKVPRNEDEEMETALNKLEKLKSDAEVERDKMDRKMLAMVLNDIDVAEVDSPPRVVQMAVRIGLIGGRSMDLKTEWDFSFRANRRRAIEAILHDDPWIIGGSPPCTMFSLLQQLNVHKFGHLSEWKKAFDEKKRVAEEHMRFCVQLYRLQVSRGRYFVHEHPGGATSWDLQFMSDLEKVNGVVRVQADQCMHDNREG